MRGNGFSLHIAIDVLVHNLHILMISEEGKERGMGK